MITTLFNLATVSRGARTLVVCGAFLVSSGIARGQGYSTTFDSLQQNSSLSGQDSWNTNDPDNGATTSGGQSIGQSDYVGVIDNYSSSGTDYWAYLGGLSHSSVVPGSNPVYLFRPFALGAPATYAFNVDMSLSSSTTYPARDSFGWTFQNASGSNLLSVNFDPVAGSGNPFAVRYSVNGGGEVTTGNGIVSNSIYHLTISVNVLADTFSVSLTPTGGSPSTLVNNASLGSVLPASVTQVAATWTLSSGTKDNGGYTGAGGNALLFNNYAVTVPEPSTWLFMIVGLAGVILCLYRKAQE